MFKVEIFFSSSIKFKNSKSTLQSIYKRLYFFKILFFFKSINKNLKLSYKTNNSILKNKLVLLRSPFHYKTSKTILNSPLQQFKISFIINKKLNTPLFFNLFFINSLLKFNKLNVFVINSIKITHNVKIKKTKSK